MWEKQFWNIPLCFFLFSSFPQLPSIFTYFLGYKYTGKSFICFITNLPLKCLRLPQNNDLSHSEIVCWVHRRPEGHKWKMDLVCPFLESLLLSFQSLSYLRMKIKELPIFTSSHLLSILIITCFVVEKLGVSLFRFQLYIRGQWKDICKEHKIWVYLRLFMTYWQCSILISLWISLIACVFTRNFLVLWICSPLPWALFVVMTGHNEVELPVMELEKQVFV